MRSARCCTSVGSSLRERRCTAPLRRSAWRSGGRSSLSAIISWDGNSPSVQDHAPLQWLHRMKDTNARITRWYLAFEGYTALQIQGGPQAGDADDCSRLPLQEWGGGGGLQAGGLPGLSRAVGVCGEGGGVQRSLQREKDSGDSGK